MTLQEEIPTLTDKNFQNFLSTNLKDIFVHETEDFEYRYFLPSHLKITSSCCAQGKFARQC